MCVKKKTSLTKLRVKTHFRWSQSSWVIWWKKYEYYFASFLKVQSHAFGTELQEKLLKQELRKKASQKAPRILCVGSGASWEEAEETNHRLRLS